MTAAHRWAAVALGVLLVFTLPVVWLHRPTPGSEISASALLARVRAAQGHPWSGYVVSQGSLQLPVATRFTDLGSLFGEQNKLRVWWRGDDAWRVDRLTTAGEDDLVHDGEQTTTYSFEDAEAVTSTDPDIRLPRTADLLPPVLVGRLLRDVDAAEATRIDTRRVGGRVAPGLRLRPASPQSSIDHVDLWADPETGVPLRVEVYGGSAGPAGLTSEIRSFDPATPGTDRVTLTPTATTEQSYDDVLDIADAANQYAPLRPPRSVAGLPETSATDGAVGVYGTGLTQLIAIPLRGREAAPLRRQIAVTPGVVVDGTGTLVAVGPLGVLLTGAGSDGGFLLAGTVTGATLRTAARDLERGVRFTDDERGRR